MKTICILGAGTYGSYIANALSDKYPGSKISIIEVGNEHIKSENEIGFLSILKQGVYKGTNKGRFFGWGGTSARWGGQLLFFSENDCPNDKRMDEIKRANITYKNTVLKRFFKVVPDLSEYEVEKGLFVKQGIWLKISHRNLFTFFKLKSKKNIQVLSGARAVKLNIHDQKIISVTIKRGDRREDINADIFYLTCGAFESLRLLSVSGIIDLEKSSDGFSDHASLRSFSIPQSHTKIGNVDFTFKFFNRSMITSRIVGEVEGLSFYVHPIFNEKFIFFQMLKKLIFKNQFSLRDIYAASTQFFHIFPFITSYFFKKKLYVFKNWSINIDIELDGNENKIVLSNKKDKYGEQGIEVFFNLPDTTIAKLTTAKEKIRDILIQNKIPFKEVNENINLAKLEDIYHPYNMYNQTKGNSLKEIYNPLSNFFVYHTGILPRAGGINPTASLFCLIEKNILEYSLIYTKC